VNQLRSEVDIACHDRNGKMPILMAQAVTIGARKFWIVSEPDAEGWKAQVLEVLDEQGSTQKMGIETTGETRGAADERALGQLQHLLRDQSL
jgi:hypothetical protein